MDPSIKRLDPHDPNLKTAYDQLCESYRAIDDFRSKLLGFLPLASAGGVFLLLGDPFADAGKSDLVKPFLLPLGLFGFVITLGLFFYEIWGIRKCRNLINAGIEMECSMGIPQGQFNNFPNSVLFFINVPFATGMVYPAVLAGWMFLIIMSRYRHLEQSLAIEIALPPAILVFVAGFILLLLFNFWLRFEKKIRKYLNVPEKGEPCKDNAKTEKSE